MGELIYCKLKLIGKVKVTDTDLPRCLAGIIVGIAFTNLKASSRRYLSWPRTTLAEEIDPDLEITNSTNIFSLIPISLSLIHI